MMKTFLATVTCSTFLLATPGYALDITFQHSSGQTSTIIDNGPGDNNGALSVIDFKSSLFGLDLTVFGRVEESLAGPVKFLRITETPGNPAVGDFQNTGNIAQVFTIIVNSSAFAAAEPPGTPWIVDYIGSGIDGTFPGSRVPCPGNGNVFIPTHNVTGMLNRGGVVLGTAPGPAFMGVPPLGFIAPTQTGLTAVPANSLQLIWQFDPDSCDGLHLPSSAEVILGAEEKEKKKKYK